jgi:hypothetical protein
VLGCGKKKNCTIIGFDKVVSLFRYIAFGKSGQINNCCYFEREKDGKAVEQPRVQHFLVPSQEATLEPS